MGYQAELLDVIATWDTSPLNQDAHNSVASKREQEFSVLPDELCGVMVTANKNTLFEFWLQSFSLDPSRQIPGLDSRFLY
jgi:hypothetical protein